MHPPSTRLVWQNAHQRIQQYHQPAWGWTLCCTFFFIGGTWTLLQLTVAWNSPLIDFCCNAIFFYESCRPQAGWGHLARVHGQLTYRARMPCTPKPQQQAKKEAWTPKTPQVAEQEATAPESPPVAEVEDRFVSALDSVSALVSVPVYCMLLSLFLSQTQGTSCSRQTGPLATPPPNPASDIALNLWYTLFVASPRPLPSLSFLPLAHWRVSLLRQFSGVLGFALFPSFKARWCLCFLKWLIKELLILYMCMCYLHIHLPSTHLVWQSVGVYDLFNSTACTAFPDSRWTAMHSTLLFLY